MKKFSLAVLASCLFVQASASQPAAFLAKTALCLAIASGKPSAVPPLTPAREVANLAKAVGVPATKNQAHRVAQQQPVNHVSNGRGSNHILVHKPNKHANQRVTAKAQQESKVSAGGRGHLNFREQLRLRKKTK